MLCMLAITVACGSDEAGDAQSSGSTEPVMLFDGERCVYEGPESFTAGSEVTFVLAESAVFEPQDGVNVGLAVWMVAPGVTAEEILEEGISRNGSQIPESGPATIGETTFGVTYELSEPGRYAVNCASRPADGPSIDSAAIFTVTE
jgi:hypothetical protein